MKQFIGKTTLVITFILVSVDCQAQVNHNQFTFGKESITIKADSMEVREAFRILDYMVPKGAWVDRIVIKDGKKWYQTKYLINRMMKRRAYTEVNGKVKLVRI